MSRDKNKIDMDDFLDDFLEEPFDDYEPIPTKFKSIPKVDVAKIQMPKLTGDRGDFYDEEIIGDEEFENTYGDDYVEDLNRDLHDDDLSEEIRAIIDWEPPEPRSTDMTLENEFISTGWIGYLHLDRILTDAILQGASDVHISANQVISFSRNGDIIRCPEYIVPTVDIMSELITGGLLNHTEQAFLNLELEYDGAYVLLHGPMADRRTRINVGLSFGEYFVVFRIINDYIPSNEELQIEEEITNWAKYPNGLFLLCGPTGSGKSTSLASIVANIQQTTKKKIITIEKPIEYIYPDDEQALVTQREVGADTRGFYEGLTSAMRQSPDVILLGEVRNTEEVKELLRAAETGHLAISTMHTNSVATTINRIQNLFEGDEQRRIMSTLSDTLRGVGNQVLVKDTDDGRFAVRELLTVNDEIRKLILAGDVNGIRKYQIAREATMEHKLAEAVDSGRCLLEEALKHTSDPLLFHKILKERGQ